MKKSGALTTDQKELTVVGFNDAVYHPPAPFSIDTAVYDYLRGGGAISERAPDVSLGYVSRVTISVVDKRLHAHNHVGIGKVPMKRKRFGDRAYLTRCDGNVSKSITSDEAFIEAACVNAPDAKTLIDRIGNLLPGTWIKVLWMQSSLDGKSSELYVTRSMLLPRENGVKVKSYYTEGEPPMWKDCVDDIPSDDADIVNFELMHCPRAKV